MDLRIQKTNRSVVNAFIKLRSKKPLNKITVTELAKEAMISKATFYLHYRDIYDLSEQLQDRLVLDIINDMPHPDRIVTHPDEYTRELIAAFGANAALTNILFPDEEKNLLAQRLEKHIKDTVYRANPRLGDSLEFDIALSMLIHGAFHTYQSHMDKDRGAAVECICKISLLLSEAVTGIHKKEAAEPPY